MATNTQHKKRVENVAKEFGATVRFDGNQHLRVEGKGWFVSLPGTPRHDYSEDRIRKHIQRGLKRCAIRKAQQI